MGVVRIKKIKPKNPSVAWELGAEARRGNETIFANPFTAQTDDAYRWVEGWEWQDRQKEATAA